MRATSFLVLVALALPTAARAADWAFVGLVETGEPAPEAELQAALQAFSAELSSEDRAIPLAALVERLGFGSVDRTSIEEALAEAEMLFFQVEYEAARQKLETALAAIEADRGKIPFEVRRDVRLLLALVFLEGFQDREAAARVLAPLAAIHVLPESVRRAAPGPVIELWDEVRAAASARTEGWLYVDCTGCHGGEVWLEGVPVGITQQSIALPPGRYSLVLRGLAGAEELRSLVHEVQIRAGEETRLLVALAAETSVLAGPAVCVQAAKLGDAVDHAARLAPRVGADRLLAWRFEQDAIRVWAFGAAGERLGSWTRPVEGEDLEATLAALAREILAPAPRAEESLPLQVLAAPDPEPSWRPVARWSALGATVALAAVGTWLAVEADSARSDLEALQAGRRSYASVEEARRASRLAETVESRQTWSAVLLTGAAAGAVGTVFLFLP